MPLAALPPCCALLGVVCGVLGRCAAALFGVWWVLLAALFPAGLFAFLLLVFVCFLPRVLFGEGLLDGLLARVLTVDCMKGCDASFVVPSCRFAFLNSTRNRSASFSASLQVYK